MARVVLATLGSYGDLFPYLVLGRSLAARGHTPVIATSPSHEPIVAAAGLAFHTLGPDIMVSDRALMRSLMGQVRGSERVMKMVLGMTRQTYAELDAAVANADLLLTHPLTFAGPLIVKKRPSLRWASSVLAPLSFFSAYDPPLMPAVPWVSDMLRRLGPRVARKLNGVSKRITAGWLGPLHDLAREHGLTLDAHPLFEGQHAPDLVLGLYSSVIGAPQPDFPPQALITGFLFYDATPPGLEASTEQARAFAAEGEPPIVVTLGSSAVLIDDSVFAETVAMGRRTIALVGPDPGAVERYRGVEHVLAVPYLPHHVVMPLASVIVHQGGVGTTGQALRSGKPAVIVPFSHDQPDNAARCARIGVAKVIPRGRYNRRTAGAAIRELLGDPAYAMHADAVGASVRAERGAETACDAIEAVLTGSARRSVSRRTA
ncbi:MAG TPA: glycosyltransferase [Gemmatimonadaceae bacterium]|nr:glycosyltransferase [Gemmatimonadaceae bacterium]